MTTMFVLLSFGLAFSCGEEDRAGNQPPNSQSAVSTEQQPLAGHSVHGEAYNEGPRQAAKLTGGFGQIKFPITSKSDQAKAFFQQGIGQLHGFLYWEAERSFREVVKLDPKCAIGYWGLALANMRQPDRAKKFLIEANQHLEHASEHERRWIAMFSTYLHVEKAKPKPATPAVNNAKPADNKAVPASTPANPKADASKPAAAPTAAKDAKPAKAEEKKVQIKIEDRRALVRAFEDLIGDFPEDIEAKAFLAWYLWENQGELKIEAYEPVYSLIKEVLAVDPRHPGAHHYTIHLWDHRNGKRALHSCGQIGPSAPKIAHQWHMAGHIYAGLHRYDDAVYMQEASARVDHEYMMRERVMPFLIHNYGHNNQWLVTDLAHLGRINDSIISAKSMVQIARHPKHNSMGNGGSITRYGQSRLLDVLERFERWDELLLAVHHGWLERGDDAEVRCAYDQWLGVALAMMGQTPASEEIAKQLAAEGLAERSKNWRHGDGGPSTANLKPTEPGGQKNANRFETAADMIRIMQASKQGKHADAYRWAKAVGGVRKSRLARLALLANEKADAERLANEEVAEKTNQADALAWQVIVLQQLGKTDAAKSAFEKLRTLAFYADLSYEPFASIAPIAKSFGVTGDWRRQPEARTDIGPRPPQESFGPLAISAWPANEFSLPDEKGEPTTLASYRGKPVVLIFYLGANCLHCVEQLSAFAPKIDAFRKQGIEVLAISTDKPADLQRTLEAWRKSSKAETADNKQANSAAQNFPIKLVSDQSLKTFKAYGAFDDFENVPLHGTFLISPKGEILFQDISFEPFAEPDFLLKESTRLLRLSGK